MKSFSEYLEDAKKCVKCAGCVSACPTFSVSGREIMGPRARVALIENRLAGEENFADAYLKTIKECTLCASCFSSCPNGVNTPDLILAARAYEAEKKGASGVLSFAMEKVLTSDRLMPFAMKLASKFQGVLFKTSPFENGLISRFSLPYVGSNRLIPPLADEFFLERPHIKALSNKGAGAKSRVGFFVGCGINYLLPDIGEATVRVLKDRAEVIVPPEQACCGIPALSNGDRDTAKLLALKNLNAFEKYELDYIVNSCATCGHSLKHLFTELLSGEGEDVRKRVERFSSKVRDITELLEGELGYEKRGDKKQGIVTYHDPCHLRRSQNISEEPRILLEKSGMTYKGMKNPCKCCGFGGGLSFTNYELSMEIAAVKAEGVRESKADMVATACPGCIIQFKDALNHYGVDAKVVHVVELL